MADDNHHFPRWKIHTAQGELPLADATGKWFGSGMDDIFFHRILIQHNAYFNEPGIYRFTFEQDMRDNPLSDVWNVGLRIEKVGHRQPIGSPDVHQADSSTTQP